MKKISLVLLITLLLSLFVLPIAVTAEGEEDTEPLKYYYAQLTTKEARGIYDALSDMAKDGKLASGTHTVELSSLGILEDKKYEKNVIMASFISARDAFMLDHPELFYVEFDKFTITVEDGKKSQTVRMGVGREHTYFADGFSADNTPEAISKFEEKISAIVSEAEKLLYLDEKIAYAYDRVVSSADYALEADAKPENVLYVRNPYGTLVMGESVCEGYARALKAVLDRLGVDSVLVQGMYNDGQYSGPHMWNYVRMDNHRWYLLDPTMETKNTGDERGYFLKTALDDEVNNYQPNGTISYSPLAFEFSYPELSTKEYIRLSHAFTVEEIDANTKKISYKGKGIAEAEADGKYIIVSYNGSDWYYFENFMEINWMGVGELIEFDRDFEGYFELYMHEFSFFAVTDIADLARESFNIDNRDPYYKYSGGEDHIFDQSKISEVIEYSAHTPVPVTKTPADSRLKGGAEYEASVTYSEDLIRAISTEGISVKLLNPIDGAKIEDLVWDQERTLTFTFTTAVTYDFSRTYYFAFENLVGEGSRLAPEPVGFTVVNNPVFECPKIEGDVSVAYASTPALISDTNLADNDWKDENGNSIADTLPSRLTLVASPIEGDDKASMIEKIEGAENILSSATYNISLGLCDKQVSYVSGKRVKVFVPFPEGYNASSGVAFKAYHFDSDGNPEEIDCISTEYGIIMMCDSFSPFAITAVAKGNVTDKKIMTVANGSGTISEELVTLAEGKKIPVKVSANEGYKLKGVTLNGETLEILEGGVVVLDYEMLKDKGDDFLLEAIFLPDTSEPGSNTLKIVLWSLFGAAVAGAAVAIAVILTKKSTNVKKQSTNKPTDNANKN